LHNWFKCRTCQEEFFMDGNKQGLIKNNCEKCGGELYKIYRKVNRVLKEGRKVNVLIGPDLEQLEKQFFVEEVHESKIDFSLQNNFTIQKNVSPGRRIRIDFSHSKQPEGRFYFESIVLEYFNSDDNDLVVSRPDYLIFQNERRAARITMNFQAGFKFDFEDKIHNDNFKKVQVSDLSTTGIFVIISDVCHEEIKKGRSVKINFEVNKNELLLKGRIVRAENIDLRNQKMGLGIEFMNIDQEKKDLIRRIQQMEIKSESKNTI